MTGFLTRWLLAFALLSLTFNPTRWNYYSWTVENYPDQAPIAVLAGLLLLAGYIIYLRATLGSIGFIGIGLVSAIVASAIWVLIDQELISLEESDRRTWVALIGLSFVLGIGLSWSHIRRAISGQYDMDDIDD